MIDILNWFRSIMNSGSVLGYFFQAVPITCIVGIIYVIIRVVIVKRNRLKVEWLQEMMKLLFTCYLTGLISLVVLPANFWLYFFDGVFCFSYSCSICQKYRNASDAHLLLYCISGSSRYFGNYRSCFFEQRIHKR